MTFDAAYPKLDDTITLSKTPNRGIIESKLRAIWRIPANERELDVQQGENLHSLKRQPRFIRAIATTLAESVVVMVFLFLILTLSSMIAYPYVGGYITWDQSGPFEFLFRFAISILPQWAFVLIITIPPLYFVFRVFRRIFPANLGGNARAYLSLSYAENLNKNSLEGTGLILIIAAISLSLGEVDTFVIAVVFCIFVQVYNGLTMYRCKRGFFGTNKAEAFELIEFIIRNRKNMKPPTSGGLVPYGSALSINDSAAADFAPEGSKNAR